MIPTFHLRCASDEYKRFKNHSIEPSDLTKFVEIIDDV